MQVLISGASGLIGSALCEALEARGDTVRRLVRGPARGADQAQWDPEAGTIDNAGFAGIDAVIHLAGENLLGYWTAAKKRRIYDSRVEGTALLAREMAQLADPPRALICASAVGYYGDRGDEVLTEGSSVGSGFLAEVVRDWEQAAEPARAAGIRVANMRCGIVQTARGGALKTSLIPFKLGLGGPFGSGRQWFSWISLDDTVGGYLFALDSADLAGPVNLTSPRPVTNGEYTRLLAQVLKRPAFLRVPKLPARLVMGEVAGELYGSLRVEPRVLEQRGFDFALPELEQTLRKELT